MNCKPGDLAVVVGSDLYTPEMANRFVVVVRPAREDEFERLIPGSRVWIVKSAVSGSQLPYRSATNRALLFWSNVRPFADECLRPIRDPGEDAQDETLLWLPSPSREKEEA